MKITHAIYTELHALQQAASKKARAFKRWLCKALKQLKTYMSCGTKAKQSS